MIEYKPFNEYSDNIPNSVTQILRHPSEINKTIELAVFNHHRFSFYYWVKWKLENSQQIDLVTFDWHQDLAYPCDIEKEELKKLNLDKLFEVNFYSSYRLNSLNDNHIMSAAYLGIIGDIWVLCRQGSFESQWEDENFIDFKGKNHTIRKFKSEKELITALIKSKIKKIFFDIDLDYFTLNNNIEPSEKYKYMKDYEIKNLLSTNNKLMKWIFQRIEGITIALEPKYTGGINKSLKFLSIIENLWFTKPIGNLHLEWKHLQDRGR